MNLKNKKVLFLLFLFLILIFGYFYYLNIQISKANYSLNKELEKFFINKDFLPDTNNAYSKLKSWNINEAISILENSQELKKWKKEDIELSKLILASSYLWYGNSFYNENEYSKKALELLNSLKIYKKSYYYYYQKWYANEIIRNYDEALVNYNEWLKYISENPAAYAIFKNQIWHIYDFKWDLSNAFINYKEAYKNFSSNSNINLNMARTLVRLWRSSEANSYFNTALSNTNSSFLKAEIYYDLWNLKLLQKSDSSLNDALKNSLLSIKENPNFPMSYILKAKVLFYLTEDNSKDYEIKELLDKSISLYQKNSLAYEYLGLLYLFNKIDYSNAIINFNKSLDLQKDDITLMWSEKMSNKWRLNMYLAFSYAWNKDEVNTMKSLKNSLITWDLYSILMFGEELKKPNNWVFVLLKDNSDFENLKKAFLSK